jgi:hypothetical protein
MEEEPPSLDALARAAFARRQAPDGVSVEAKRMSNILSPVATKPCRAVKSRSRMSARKANDYRCP